VKKWKRIQAANGAGPLPDVDLRVQWERWADGRAFRLKRKRHLADVDPSLVAKAAAGAAADMGKAVLTTRDRLIPDKYLWVQFADGKINPNKPCPTCGSRRLLRLHANFVRCPECHVQLLLTDEPVEDAARETRAMQTLRKLTDVHLALRGEGADASLVLYRGYARKADELVFLLVEFKRGEDKDTVDDEEVFQRVRTVRVVPFSELGDFFGTDVVDPQSPPSRRHERWDLVW
jgi:hypothetical protein